MKRKNVTFISMISANILVIFLIVFLFSTNSRGDSNDTSNINDTSIGKRLEFLEKYGYFGIICKKLNLSHDLNTNFIAVYHRNNNRYKMNTSLTSYGSNASGLYNSNNKIKYCGIEDYVNDWFEKISEESTGLLSKFPSELLIDEDNNYEIDVSNKKDFICLNLDTGDESITIKSLKLTMRPNQTVVFNLPSNKEVTIKKYGVTLVVNSVESTALSDIADNVIFNMPETQNVQLDSENLYATIIAPNANVTINKSGYGWLVGETVNCNANWTLPFIINGEDPLYNVEMEPWPSPSEEPEPCPPPSEEPPPCPPPTEEPEPSPTEEPEPSPTEEPELSPTEEPESSLSDESTPSPSEKPTLAEKPTLSPSEEPIQFDDMSSYTTDESSQFEEPYTYEDESIEEDNIEDDVIKTGDNIIKVIFILIISIGILLVTIYKRKKITQKIKRNKK